MDEGLASPALALRATAAKPHDNMAVRKNLIALKNVAYRLGKVSLESGAL